MAKFIIVDRDDNVIGYKERNEILPEDIYRVSALLIGNSKGEILLARRALTKKHDPWKWGPSVAGTVEEGETYESNIIKETEEELGVSIQNPIPWKKLFNDGEHKYFGQWFTAHLDKPIEDFNFQKEEVEGIRWVGKDELEKEFKANPESFLKSAPQWMQMIKETNGN